MSDMWTSINLEADVALTVKPLAEWPDDLAHFDKESAQETLDDGGTLRDYLDRAFESFVDENMSYAEYDNAVGYLSGAGGSKYQVGDANQFAAEATLITNGIAAVNEEWTGEDPNTNHTVYVNGELDRGQSQHSAMVPDNLDELIAAVRKALEPGAAITTYETNKRPVHHLNVAAQALVDALDPRSTEQDRRSL